jgi:predicted SAM-dependent methyltransferase
MQLVNRVGRTVKEALRARVDAQPDGLRTAIRNLWNEIRTARIARSAAGSFAALKGRQNLKVHVGAGDEIKPGWVNIDLMLRPPHGFDPAAHADTVLINYDLRRGLPLEVESCELIYSSHFFEHLEYGQGLRLMRDCFRALKPGGTFRLALPNFRGLFEAYLKGDEAYVDGINIREVLPEVEPGTETFVDHINYGVYQYGEHKYIYDEDKLILILKRIGYSRVAASDYREGIDPASSVRRRYSFYVEAVK